jgi:unsaturated rhamnogalacturonyl hydrolase
VNAHPGIRLFTATSLLGGRSFRISKYGRSDTMTQENLSKEHPVRSIGELLRVVATRQIRELEEGEYQRGDWNTVLKSKPPKGIQWDYPWGVTLYGLLRVSEVLDDKNLEAFVLEHNRIAADQFAYLRWQRDTFGQYTNPAGMEELMVLDRLDYCGAMTSQFLEGILCHNAKVTPEMDALLKVVADYISTGQSRLPDGTLWRPECDETIWADDLYMSCPFLVRYAEYSKDESYLNDAVKQTLNMASYLQDSDGVWFHGYSVTDKKPIGFKWGRANGWAMVSTAEVLSAMPKDHPENEKVLSVLRRHIQGVKRLQALSGLWHQVLDHPELWEETSCTAMFAYAISRAVNRGWIAKNNLDAAQKALGGLHQKITEDGAILDVCQGTGIGCDLAFYEQRGRPFDDHHGQGAVLLALTELFYAAQSELLPPEGVVYAD